MAKKPKYPAHYLRPSELKSSRVECVANLMPCQPHPRLGRSRCLMYGRIVIVRGDKFVIASSEVDCLGCRCAPSVVPRKDQHVWYDAATNEVRTLKDRTIGRIVERGTVDAITAWLVKDE